MPSYISGIIVLPEVSTTPACFNCTRPFSIVTSLYALAYPFMNLPTRIISLSLIISAFELQIADLLFAR